MRDGQSTGKLVHKGALPRRGPARRGTPVTASAKHLALVESAWRMAYVLATLNREQMLDDGYESELSGTVPDCTR